MIKSKGLQEKLGLTGFDIVMLGGAIAVNIITLPVSVPIFIYKSLRDLKYKNDKSVIGYPSADDWSDLDARMSVRGPPWIRTGVEEIPLDSRRTAVYSLIASHATLPETRFVQIEGYKLNSRYVRRFPRQEGNSIIDEVSRKLEKKYDMKKFDHVECMH